MKFAKASIVTLLASCSAVLADVQCSSTNKVTKEDADEIVSWFENLIQEYTAHKDEEELPVYKAARVFVHSEGADEATSLYKDIGAGIQGIIDQCPGDLTGGSNAAGGNGNFIIRLATE